MELLAPDVVFTGDGGGVVAAARHPVEGADRVVRFVLGLVRLAGDGPWELHPVEVNGEPGVVGVHAGEVDTVLALHVADGRVVGLHGVRNPAKLAAVQRQLAARHNG